MYHTAKRVRKRKHRLWVPALLVLLGWIALRGVYFVTDGNRVIPCYVPFASRSEVLAQAGVVMDPLDESELTRGFGVGFLTVVRAPRVALRYRGTAMSVATRGETVSQLLKRLDRLPEEGDVVSLPADTRLQDGMALAVDQVQHRQERYTAVLPFTTEYQQDTAAPWGEETVLDPGAEGELRVTADVEYTNGRETGREILHQQEISAPHTRVISVGTSEKASLPQIHYNYLTLPNGQMLPYTKTLVVEATAYTGTDAGCNPVTATGTQVHRGTVCVDPDFIPFGTRMFLMASDGSYVYGVAQAEDCREGIEGYRVDLYLPTARECAEFDRRSCTLFVLG